MTDLTPSKALGNYDQCWFDFVSDIMDGEGIATVNVEAILYFDGGYHLFEGLKCEQEQMDKHGVTPWNSHPNKYFWQNSQKFISLFRLKWHLSQGCEKPAKLWLINYAELGSEYEDQILVLDVIQVNPGNFRSPVLTDSKKYTKETFREWYVDLNRKAREPKEYKENYPWLPT